MSNLLVELNKFTGSAFIEVCTVLYPCTFNISAGNSHNTLLFQGQWILQGHLKHSGSGAISQSQKQDPVHISYQCKGQYLFFQVTILLTYFITSVQSYTSCKDILFA